MNTHTCAMIGGNVRAFSQAHHNHCAACVAGGLYMRALSALLGPQEHHVSSQCEGTSATGRSVRTHHDVRFTDAGRHAACCQTVFVCCQQEPSARCGFVFTAAGHNHEAITS